MLEVVKCTFGDVETAASFPSMVVEYTEESSIKGMPPINVKFDTYRHLDSIGTMHSFGAFLDGLLVGFVLIVVPVLPHYGIGVAISESFFVSRAHRKSGAGTKLRLAGEAFAAEIGSPGFLISAPVGGILAEILPHVGYEETNRVFFKRIGRE